MKILGLRYLISAIVLLIAMAAPVYGAVMSVVPQSCVLSDGRGCFSSPPTVINKDISSYAIGDVWNCGGGTAVLKMTVPVETRFGFNSEWDRANFSINPAVTGNNLLANVPYTVTVNDPWCSSSTFTFPRTYISFYAGVLEQKQLVNMNLEVPQSINQTITTEISPKDIGLVTDCNTQKLQPTLVFRATDANADPSTTFLIRISGDDWKFPSVQPYTLTSLSSEVGREVSVQGIGSCGNLKVSISRIK